MADVTVPEYIPGCKALGLVNKIVTGPLWHVMESQDATILNMNEKFYHLKSCLEEWSQDATSVLSGEAVLHSDFLPTKDRIFESLVAPSVYDATVEEILKYYQVHFRLWHLVWLRISYQGTSIIIHLLG